MISTQVNNAVLCPKAYLINRHHVKGLNPLPPPTFVRCLPSKIQASLKITANPLKWRQSMPVCSSGGEARVGNGNQEPLWKSFGKAIENLGKKPSIEDVLKQQIEKGEYYEGGNPPGRGGGGSGGGGGGFGGLGGYDEEGSSGMLEETMQVIFATLGFISLYLYIINGAEMMMLIRDYFKYVMGGKKSLRLDRTIHMWKNLFGKLTENNRRDKYWLQRAIINTPTWWDSPENYKRILKAYAQQKFGQPNDDGYDDDDHDDVSQMSKF